MDQLAIRWAELMRPLLPNQQLKNCWQIITDHYCEEHRHYHNLHHIQACLKHFDLIKSQLEQPILIEVSIWLHDLIYKVKRSDNELKSGEKAIKMLKKSNFTQNEIEQIYANILATKHPALPANSDQAFLLDIDLSILGAKPELYAQYEQWIRQEYQQIPNFLYKIGRKKLLKSFLNQTKIFQTEYFYAIAEQQARNNLAWAINQL